MSITIEKLKVGDRVVVENKMIKQKRCIIKEFTRQQIVMEIIEQDREEGDTGELLVGWNCFDDFDEWGVTKEYKVTFLVSVDTDVCGDIYPDQDAMQKGFDREYDGGMTLTEEAGVECVHTYQNEMPEPEIPVETKIANVIMQLEELLPGTIKQMHEAGTLQGTSLRIAQEKGLV